MSKPLAQVDCSQPHDKSTCPSKGLGGGEGGGGGRVLGSEKVGALTLAALNMLLLILGRPLVPLLNEFDLLPSQFILSLLPKRRKRRSLPLALRLIRHGWDGSV